MSNNHLEDFFCDSCSKNEMFRTICSPFESISVEKQLSEDGNFFFKNQYEEGNSRNSSMESWKEWFQQSKIIFTVKIKYAKCFA